MSVNSRFAISIHMLALLALNQGKSLTSAFISNSVNTNPVFVRRILRALSKAGLVTTQLGVDGGSRLARSPNEITLLAVYQATEPGSLFTLHHSRPNPLCPCGGNIQPI